MPFLDDIDPKTVLAACGLVVMAAVSNVADPATTGSTATDPAPSRAERAAVSRDKPAAAKRPAVPSTSVLMPHRVQGRQVAFRPSGEQVANARTIIRVGRRMGLPPRAAVIAVATSLQEAKLTNLGHLGARNDHDSQGLFQQRPTTGWGTVAEIRDPVHASTAFYNALKKVPRWQSMPLTRAAQTVQVSAFPDAYAKWEKMATDLVLAYFGDGPYAGIAKAVEKAEKGKADKSRAAADRARKARKEAKDKARNKHRKPGTRNNGLPLPGWLG